MAEFGGRRSGAKGAEGLSTGAGSMHCRTILIADSGKDTPRYSSETTASHGSLPQQDAPASPSGAVAAGLAQQEIAVGGPWALQASSPPWRVQAEPPGAPSQQHGIAPDTSAAATPQMRSTTMVRAIFLEIIIKRYPFPRMHTCHNVVLMSISKSAVRAPQTNSNPPSLGPR